MSKHKNTKPAVILGAARVTDLKALLEYIQIDEERHFEDMKCTEGAANCRDHIYHVIRRLREVVPGRGKENSHLGTHMT